MPRKPRIYLDNMPYHIVNRGHNRMPCFGYESEKARFFSILSDKLSEFSIKLHAFVLMSNHYHLLLTAPDGAAIPHFMQCLGRKYAGYYNLKHDKTGAVWDGKYFASLVESDYYLLACYRYIELNPVRAGITDTPGGYDWSSYNTNACGVESAILHPHPTYLALGSTPFNRLKAYRELFNHPMNEIELAAIRLALSKNRMIKPTATLLRPQNDTQLTHSASIA